jgi:anti-sigma regulatory factor (Ser/Thr protein kinase)
MNLDLVKDVLVKINQSRRNEKISIKLPEDLDKHTLILLKFLFNLKIKEKYLIEVSPKFIESNFLITNISSFNLDFDKFIEKYNFPFNIKNIISFIVGELYDNIKEHAHSFDVYLDLEKDKDIYLGVFDNGITIFNRYKEAGIEVKDYKEAIEKALEGVSAKSIEERGYGLRTIKKIINNINGKMYVFSGEAYGVIDKQEKVNFLDFYFPGTGVILSFPLTSKNLSDIL